MSNVLHSLFILEDLKNSNIGISGGRAVEANTPSSPYNKANRSTFSKCITCVEA